MRQKGFSLLELMIVFGIGGVILALAFPAFSHFQQNLYLDFSTRALAVKFRQTQSRAMCINQPLETDNQNLLATGVTLRHGKRFVFSRSGSVMPGGTGTEWLENRQGKSKKIIVSAAGRIRIE